MPQALSHEAGAVLEHLIKGLEVGGAAKFNNAPRMFMAVCVDRLSARHYSVAHYYEQNGDLMADPDMTFYRTEDGQFYPCSFQQDSLAVYQEGLEIREDGTIVSLHETVQASQADFANTWMRNIADQQGLPFSFPESDDV